MLLKVEIRPAFLRSHKDTRTRRLWFQTVSTSHRFFLPTISLS